MQLEVPRVLRDLQTAGDPARARFMGGYSPTTERHLGVPAPALHRLARELAPKRSAPPGLDDALALMTTGVLDARILAYLILERTRAPLDRDALDRLGEGMEGWGAVDAFGSCCSGPALVRSWIDLETPLAWAERSSRWWRRAALVTTTTLNKRSRGGTGDTARTLAVCERLATDPDDMVVKALSWALRELAPWDPSAIRGFLDAHEVEARVRREVSRKLETGRKSG